MPTPPERFTISPGTSFCSFYVEMVKERLQDDAQRKTAQRVLAHALDTLLRLLHPMIPFLTEDVWCRLNALAPERGIDEPRPAAESVMRAAWPGSSSKEGATAGLSSSAGGIHRKNTAGQASSGTRRQDPAIEAQFARFQEVLRAVRDIRAKQNVPPKTTIKFSVRCGREIADLLTPMKPYFASMAGAEPVEFGPEAAAPALSAGATMSNIEVFVDLAGLIDVEVEIARKRKEAEKLVGFITAKEKKLSNAGFVDRAPAEVVQKERESLDDLKAQLAAIEQLIERLGK